MRESLHVPVALAAALVVVLACSGQRPLTDDDPRPATAPPASRGVTTPAPATSGNRATPPPDAGNPTPANPGSPGGIDNDFGIGGIRQQDMGGTDDHAYGVVVTPDGGAIVVGEARPNEQSLVSFALARFSPGGRIDPTFGPDGNGTVFTPYSDFNGSGATAAALQPDGKIVVVGYGPNEELHHETFAMARYNANGSLDEDFGIGGQVLTAIYTDPGAGPEDRANAVAIDDQGRILVAGESGSFFYDFALVRYNADGSLDDTFGDGGRVVLDFGGDDRATSVAVTPDGSILVGGHGWLTSGDDEANGAADFALARFDSTGQVDASFGANGVALTDFRGGDDDAQQVLVRPDGRILLAGTIQLSGGCSPSTCERYGFGLAQYTANGLPDTAFGTEGKIEPDFTVSSGAYDAVLMPDGVVALVGHIGNEDFGISFVNEAGGPILIEDGSEAARIDFAGGSDRAFGAALGPGNSVVLAGDASTPDGAFDFGLARYIAPTAP